MNHSNILSSAGVFLAAVFFTLATTEFAPAQGRVRVAPVGAEDEKEKQRKAESRERWEKALEAIRKSSRDGVVRHLEVIVSEIDRSSKLQDDQKMKLKVGAKGAADRAVEQWVQNLERQDGLIQNLEAAAANIKKEEEAVRFEQLIAQWGRQLQPQTAESQAIWKTTLDKTLTDEQKKAWEETKKQRVAYSRSLQVAQLVQQADNMLRLTADQRQKLFNLLSGVKTDEKKEGDQPNVGHGGNGGVVAINQNGNIVVQGLQVRGNAQVVVNGQVINGNTGRSGAIPNLNGLPREKVEEFLTEEQMKQWDHFTKNPNGMANRGMWFNGNGIQVFQNQILTD
ncbi:MAG: hypothetical protein HKN23_18850 [Verrucomicrobiales bacterium]|nr:hypothetical protein [Verrucomicrobiales bacterium]